MTDKKVEIEHKRSTISEKQYVKGIVQNLSMQRWTDQEISDYLHNEKQIDIARSTVTGIRNNIEKQAEKWYIELKKSRYKYIVVYKQRIDSLMSYQKKLNQIVDFYLDPPHQILYSDTIIRAIAELHKIELSILNLWRQLPTFSVQVDKKHNKDLLGLENEPTDVSPYIKCVGCHNWFKDNETLRIHNTLPGACSLTFIGEPLEDEDEDEEGPSGLEFKPENEEDEAAEGQSVKPENEKEPVQCSDCKRWFKDDTMIKVHNCLENDVSRT